MIKFQYYHGDIKKSRPIGFISLETFIDKHVNPSAKMLAVFNQIEKATAEGNKKLKSELKMQNLFSFTVSARFNGRRRYNDITEFNPIAQLDFDGIEDSEASSFRDFIFNNYKQVICAYLSPSRKGVKVLLRIPKIELTKGIKEGIKEYKDYYRAIESEFGAYIGFDPAPKNLVLPLFISYDFEGKFRSFEDTKEWNLKEFEEEPMHLKYPLPSKPYRKLKSNDQNELRAIRTVRKMISGIISSPGHYKLRSACLIFGTRVGAGYVDVFEAEREIEQLVRQNTYLSKGVSGYLTTAKWALREGVKTPNYYN